MVLAVKSQLEQNGPFLCSLFTIVALKFHYRFKNRSLITATFLINHGCYNVPAIYESSNLIYFDLRVNQQKHHILLTAAIACTIRICQLASNGKRKIIITKIIRNKTTRISLISYHKKKSSNMSLAFFVDLRNCSHVLAPNSLRVFFRLNPVFHKINIMRGPRT